VHSVHVFGGGGCSLARSPRTIGIRREHDIKSFLNLTDVLHGFSQSLQTEARIVI
jgi:hypothetical protein